MLTNILKVLCFWHKKHLLTQVNKQEIENGPRWMTHYFRHGNTVQIRDSFWLDSTINDFDLQVNAGIDTSSFTRSDRLTTQTQHIFRTYIEVSTIQYVFIYLSNLQIWRIHVQLYIHTRYSNRLDYIYRQVTSDPDQNALIR